MAWTSYEVEWWKEWVLSEALRLGVVPEAQNGGLEFKVLFNICKGAKSDFRTCSEVLTASGNITLNLDCVLPQFHFVKRNTWELQKYLFTVCVLNSKYGILKCIKIVCAACVHDTTILGLLPCSGFEFSQLKPSVSKWLCENLFYSIKYSSTAFYMYCFCSHCSTFLHWPIFFWCVTWKNFVFFFLIFLCFEDWFSLNLRLVSHRITLHSFLEPWK